MSFTSSSGNGIYSIFPPDGSIQRVYCHMDEIAVCGGGGWRIVMKIDGKKVNIFSGYSLSTVEGKQFYFINCFFFMGGGGSEEGWGGGRGRKWETECA